MTEPKFQRFTYPMVLEQIPAAPLARFFDRFKDELLAKNCRLPSAPVRSECYLEGIDNDPEAELRRLRSFCSDIVALRRGDLYASRLGIEQARLAAEQADTETQKEKEFWAWTTRPDIQAKLYPKRDEDQIRREVVRMLDRELLGIRDPRDEQDEPDPAALI